MNYRDIVNQITKTEKELQDERAHLAETQERLRQDRELLNSLDSRFKEAVIKKADDHIRKIEKEEGEIRNRIIRNERFSSALEERISRLESDLEDLKIKDMEAFIVNTREWLLEEVKGHDKLAREFQKRIRRLLACYQILREMNRGEVYQEIIGEALPYILSERAIFLDEFRVDDFRNYKAHFVSQGDLKNVRSEIKERR